MGLVKDGGAQRADGEMHAKWVCVDDLARGLRFVADRERIWLPCVDGLEADDPSALIEHQLDRLRRSESLPANLVYVNAATRIHCYPQTLASDGVIRPAAKCCPML